MKHKAIFVIAWLALLCVVGGMAWGDSLHINDIQTVHEDNVFHLHWHDNGR